MHANSNSIALPSAELLIERNEFTDTPPAQESFPNPADMNVLLHSLGDKCEESLRRIKFDFLELAIILRTAKLALGCFGRDSQFPTWLRRYATELDRKTVDRLISVATAFALNEDSVSTFRPLAQNIRLTALYYLSRPSVPSEARDEALGLAKAGQTVGLNEARHIVEAHALTDFLGKPAAISEKLVRLPAGTVKISINHDDFHQALIEALDLLDEG